MKVYLVRHGQALSSQESPDRALSETGRSEVARVADILEQMNATVDHMVHSGKTRAQQTAEILAQSVLYEVELESAPDMNPNDPVDPWVEKLSEMTEDTMLVGHMPFMGKLLSRLVVGPEDSDVFRFAAGAVVCLERSEKGTWAVIAAVAPSI